jgi:hypothetical protein
VRAPGSLGQCVAASGHVQPALRSLLWHTGPTEFYAGSVFSGSATRLSADDVDLGYHRSYQRPRRVRKVIESAFLTCNKPLSSPERGGGGELG